MRHLRTGLFLMMLATMPGATPPVSAQAATSFERFTVPFDFDDVTPCSSETVTMTGELTITTRTTVDNQGNTHIAYTLVPSHVRGEDTSGTAYKAVGGQREHINAFENTSQFVDTFTSMFNMVSAGGTDNFTITIVFHVTVTADGTVTVLFERGGNECHG